MTGSAENVLMRARSADARYQALSQNFEKLKGQMGQVNDQSIGLEALERDAVVNRNLLEAMLNRVKQSSGAEDILQANAKLVSPAAPGEAPTYPPKTLIAFLGAVGGLLLGSAIALLREGGDQTFRRADQIEALTGLPVLAMVPQVGGRTPPSMQVLRQPTSTYSESLRRVQIGIELSEAAASPKTILFSSATPSEGKSVMVASLGRLLASNGRRILLIDCDWRSPRLHQIFQGHAARRLLLPAGRQDRHAGRHHPSRRALGRRCADLRPVEPAPGPSAQLRSHAPADRSARASL